MRGGRMKWLTWPAAVVIIFTTPCLVLGLGIYLDYRKDKKGYKRYLREVPVFNVPELRERMTDALVDSRRSYTNQGNGEDSHVGDLDLSQIERDVEVGMIVIEEWITESHG